jgi:hypothetical protein
MTGPFDFVGQRSFTGEYADIPERMRGGMIRYVNAGILPGDFLVAVITNDLKEAVGRADDENVQLIPLYVRWFYNQAPSPCWGLPKRLREWVQERQEEAA